MTASGRADALTALAPGASVSPDQVLFESRGVVLVLGDDARAGEAAQELARHHRTVVFAPGVDALEFGPRITAVGRRVTAVRGHLGAFQAEVRSAAGPSDVGAASPNPNRFFDIVLDLSQQPLMAAELAPLGYFAPAEDSAARATAIESMRSLLGRFTRPRHLSYHPELCAHGARGLRACTSCLNVCSAQAIVSAADTIRVDPHLCQGCATCTLACPSGALSFKFPSREALGERLLHTLRGCDSAEATLIAHAGVLDDAALAAMVKHKALSFAVDPLPAFGEELWLRVLTLGVGTLVLLDDGTLLEKSRITMATRVTQVRAMLAALGQAQERLVWLSQDELALWLDAHSRHAKVEGVLPAQSAAVVSTGRSKRLASLGALRELSFAVGASTNVDLPVGASYGEVRVNPRRCTLCFACSQLCPTGALVANNAKTQQLLFRESACVQCGLCVRGCPEKALALHARLAPMTLTETASRVLQQDQQLACKSCGTPFISRRLLTSSLERLKNHPLLAKDGREALLTCPACRQREILNLS